LNGLEANKLDPHFKFEVSQHPGGKAIKACFACGACTGGCPVAEVHSAYDPRKIIRMILLGMREQVLSSELIWNCSMCNTCSFHCPQGVEFTKVVSVLREIAVTDGKVKPSFLTKVEMIRDNLEESRNVFAEDNEERADWVEDMPDAPDHAYLKDQAEVVYFTGCVAAYFPLAQKIPAALAEILDAADVDFALLGEEEWCCGFPLLGAGLNKTARDLIDHNVEAVRGKGAARIVFGCPSCYAMWHEYYPHEFEIFHASQFILTLFRENRIPLHELPLTVTYHDPCDLGRGTRVFEAPRELIRSIPGIKLVELSSNREQCRCCGGGGNLEMFDPQLSAEIAKKKIEEVMSTGARAVVTSCQQCVRTMTAYVRKNKIPLEVMDITQLVQRALKQ